MTVRVLNIVKSLIPVLYIQCKLTYTMLHIKSGHKDEAHISLLLL